jgi:DNA-binding NtrC family response regulator
MHHKDVRVLVVDDEETYRFMLKTLLEAEGFAPTTANDGVQAINAVQARSFDIVLLDVKMPKVDGVEALRFIKENFPDTEVIMLTGVGDVKIAVECMKAGAYDFLTKPYSTEELLTTVERALERKKLLRENLLMKSELSRLVGSSDLVGRSKALEKVMGVAAKVAPTESTVLIQGATGTGKELVASFIYKNSSRKEGPFVAVNCASIPDTLIESELFGHEKGAFTDARAMKQGLVEVANGGTLFLDEIGDISLTVQPKLLRFIQTGEFRRVGGTNVLKSEVRILSATNKDLQEEVHRGRFREDLLYRINVITLGLPTLKQRPEDIPLLVENFLKNKLRTKVQKQISPKAVEVLRKYDWPGNVRELENVIERAAILCRDDMIRPEDLSLPLRATMLSETLEEQGLVGSLVSMKDIEHKHIEGVLRNVAGNKTEAAKILGISLKTLYTKIQTYQIKLD